MSGMTFLYDEQNPCLLRQAAPGHHRKKISIKKLIKSRADIISFQQAYWLIEARLVRLIRLSSIKIITKIDMMWPKEYISFYAKYRGLFDRLQQKRRCTLTRRLNSCFRRLFQHLDLSKLLPERQRTLEHLVRQIRTLVDNPDHRLDQEALPVPTQAA